MSCQSGRFGPELSKPFAETAQPGKPAAVARMHVPNGAILYLAEFLVVRCLESLDKQPYVQFIPNLLKRVIIPDPWCQTP